MLIAILLTIGLQASTPRTFIMPPKAAATEGRQIDQIVLSPIFATDFACQEHFEGQIPYAGDALGTDCLVTGGVDGDSGFSKFYRTDGATNEDWYGWHAEVLAPIDGVVAGLLAKSEVNRPGTLGRPPAAMIQLRSDDGIIVTLAHLTDFKVKRGDRVKQGQPIALDGNNGFARSPHVHVGAYREKGATPLQIRWDLRAMAQIRAQKD